MVSRPITTTRVPHKTPVGNYLFFVGHMVCLSPVRFFLARQNPSPLRFCRLVSVPFFRVPITLRKHAPEMTHCGSPHAAYRTSQGVSLKLCVAKTPFHTPVRFRISALNIARAGSAPMAQKWCIEATQSQNICFNLQPRLLPPTAAPDAA